MMFKTKKHTGYRKVHVVYTLMTICCILIISMTNLLSDYNTIYYIKTGRLLNHRNQTFTTTFPVDIRHNWQETSNQPIVLYLLSAIGSYTTEYVDYQQDIKLIGWLDSEHNKPLKCCFLLMNKTISTFYNPRSILSNRESTRLRASETACPVNRFSDIVGVDIQPAESKCSTNAKVYLKPDLPEKTVNKKNSFAVCLKLVYGNIDNKLFIDWIEFYREMKVDRIFIFTYNVTITTDDIINHYVQLGLVERHQFDYPMKSTRRLGEKQHSYYEDERVILFDCLQRSSVYKYMTVADMDEFLLPRKHNNFKAMMKYLMQINPTAAGFRISPYLFVKDVGPDRNAPINGSDVEKYFLRTGALKGRRSRHKNIILPSRITARQYGTHGFIPSKGYTRGEIPPSVASTNHYRKCYENQKEICTKPLTTDKYILKFVERFKKRTWYPDVTTNDTQFN